MKFSNILNVTKKVPSVFWERVAVIVLLTLTFFACQEKGGGEYTVTMDLSLFSENGLTLDSALLFNEEQVFNETQKPEKMLQFNGSVDKACPAKLVLYLSKDGEKMPSALNLVLEPGNITFDAESSTFKGTALNDSINAFFTNLFAAYEKHEDNKIKDELLSYANRHKDDVSLVAILTNDITTSLLDPATLVKALAICSDGNKQLPAMKELVVKCEEWNKTGEGQIFTDFECEYDGKVQHLSDYVGRGKFVLVDFWASWCGPCCGEIPNLISVYNKYKGDNFEVIGVATWDEPDATLKAIKEECVTYPQIINAQDVGSKAYGITGIPEIILFAPDGTILKRGLRGENIEAAVKESLGL